jgi:hypothetical protein
MVRGGEVMLNSKTKCVWCFDFDFDLPGNQSRPSSFPFPSGVASNVDEALKWGYTESLYEIAD